MSNISHITLGDITYDIKDRSVPRIYYGTCSTASEARIKEVVIDSNDFYCVSGTLIAVKFYTTNSCDATSTNPIQLKVETLDAASIYYNTGIPTSGTNVIPFGTANIINYYMWDGTYWLFVGHSIDSNTTYSGMTSAEINAGTSTTNRLISPINLKTAIETHAPVQMKDVYGRGDQIPNGTDLHDITTPGIYYCGSTAQARTLLNCPVENAFRLVVTNTVSDWGENTRIRHDLYPSGSASSAVYSENLGTITTAYPDGWRPWGVMYNTIDAVPTSGSQYAVSSGGVYDALEEKLDVSAIDDEIKPSSTNPVQNGVISAALNSTKESVLSELYLGVTLSTGTDFNTLLTPGVYRIISGSDAQTMVNCPSTAAGRLEVIYLWATNRYLQRYYPSGARFYMRAYTGNGWGHWFEYAGVDTGA